MTGKMRCKAGLLEEMGWHRDLSGRPLIAMVSRLAAQKGCDLLVQAAEDILALNVGLVILGAGDETYESLLRALGEKHPERVAVRIGFDDDLAHRIMGGADMLLVPSSYEPCGLTQMYGLRYGTVPIVRATGGLDGTIEQFDEDADAGTGFKFSEYEPDAFLDQVKRAVKVFEDTSQWRKIVARGMKADFSWERSAREYELLYAKAAEQARRDGSLQGR
jgi:starch synthase